MTRFPLLRVASEPQQAPLTGLILTILKQGKHWCLFARPCMERVGLGAFDSNGEACHFS